MTEDSPIEESEITQQDDIAPQETPEAAPTVQVQPLSPSDERMWAMLAHLSVLLNLVTGFLGPIAALIIYIVFRDRSRYVAYQSLQALVFQLFWWVGAGILAGLAWALSGVLTVVLVGFCLMPIAFLISLIPIGALIYGVVGAIETSQGKDFKYWLVGDWVRGSLEGKTSNSAPALEFIVRPHLTFGLGTNTIKQNTT